MALAAVAGTSYACATAMTDSPSLFNVIANLRQVPPRTVAVVEHTIGHKIAIIEENEDFRSYQARDITIHKYIIQLVDFREPVVGGGATVGALLALDVQGACIERKDLEQHYGKLIPGEIPSPHGAPGTGSFYYDQQEPWGRLSFGFAAHNSRCLSRVVFNVKAGDAR